jgi:hypothetical protein
MAASEASLMAHCLLIIWSQIFNLLDSSTEPFVILNPHGYLVFADFILLKSILTLFPEFSIKILENYSKLYAYFVNEYCSRPVHKVASYSNLIPSWDSIAPAPGTNL